MNRISRNRVRPHWKQTEYLVLMWLHFLCSRYLSLLSFIILSPLYSSFPHSKKEEEVRKWEVGKTGREEAGKDGRREWTWVSEEVEKRGGNSWQGLSLWSSPAPLCPPPPLQPTTNAVHSGRKPLTPVNDTPKRWQSVCQLTFG